MNNILLKVDVCECNCIGTDIQTINWRGFGYNTTNSDLTIIQIQYKINFNPKSTFTLYYDDGEPNDAKKTELKH